MRKIPTITLSLFLLCSINSIKAQAQDCPYPIIFLHGWLGSDIAFQLIHEDPDFQNIWGNLDDAYHAVLNATTESNIWGVDGIPNTPDDDVLVTFDNETNVLASGCIYTINFENYWNEDPLHPAILYNSGDTPSSFDSDSNEASILKQGYVVGKMIEKVLAANPGKEKVILIGHSMGGLAAREYLQRRVPENPTGTPRWWVNPNIPGGHKVAKLITVTTPHLGGDGDNDNLFTNPDNDEKKDNVPDLASEAVRDLRFNNPCGFLNLDNCAGPYLYGGDENEFGTFPFPYWSEDVDCDGDETSDNIIGINIDGMTQGNGNEWEGTYDNPELPLPLDIRYTWLTSDIAAFSGDGVVSWARQWLYDGTTPKPDDGTAFRLTDTMLTNYTHAGILAGVEVIARTIDEGDFPKFAWDLETDKLYNGMLQVRSVNTPDAPFNKDPDWFKFTIPATQSQEITISLNPNSNRSGRIDFFETAPTNYADMSVNGSHFESFPSGSNSVHLIILNSNFTPGDDYYFRIIHENVAYDDWKNPFDVIINTTIIFPIELVDFSGNSLENKIKLSWTTEQEINAHHFEIEKATNDFNFEKIASLSADGNSESRITYHFEDLEPNLGDNFYRLKMVDLGGQFEYSETINVRYKGSGFFIENIFPNPAKDIINIQLFSENAGLVKVNIFDLLGRMVHHFDENVSIGTSEIPIAINGWLSGRYYLKIELDGVVENQHFLKE